MPFPDVFKCSVKPPASLAIGDALTYLTLSLTNPCASPTMSSFVSASSKSGMLILALIILLPNDWPALALISMRLPSTNMFKLIPSILGQPVL